MAGSVRIVGLQELERSLKQMRKEVLRELRPQLRAAGELVRAEGQARFSRYSPSSAAGYKVRVRKRGVAVEQSIPRSTGLRGDYGALQMNRALLPALASQESAVVAKVQEMVDTAAANAGLS